MQNQLVGNRFDNWVSRHPGIVVLILVLTMGLLMNGCPEIASAQNGSDAALITGIETRGEPFLAKIVGEPMKVGRFGDYAVFEVNLIRCIDRDCTTPLKAFTHLRRGESLKSGDEVVVWKFAKPTRNGTEEEGLVALKVNTETARDLIMTIRNKRGSIAPAKPKG
ncbi:hypothetical protein C4571_03370 [Candidatus Parcubacteria bacterium]|nr:MAG: hypothetical protein C4571_03370 [Candidatus Parcubacteria bacterium]